ncbi:MAG: exodeoxyribonuclease VII small subunit [Trichodesmium sp. St15_bin1_1]|jgi:Exonuclease VII small subunit|nr:exodeoxyribonuclease VII small subunit [Trichodesmium sp. St5_bin2_1]MDE5084743.1 exodeoxyribonuclease VII small subunit [Trichodesmium sp. St18_bin1]MDE5086025.1 exodeoxyribonuclease VII small subunit [Trichodesmium sp. St16_bin2-tuft]MDE5112429.1 exodeoxyribonuclease VII small subunit [Trichodesmium sp. St7_bin2_1]MDE5112789.1 exodeoxyribonuclease VII small subunit [Trichodesmium sp. St15_bin1_1]MDE5116447.1 exodeoxyribonuclease VII small subunit [Trichodesmium sp. St2_bin2_1]MDE5121037.
MEFDYEKTVINIQDIIAEIESGQLTLEEVFEKFSVAVADLQKCEDFLTKSQQKIDLLIETLEDDF